MRAVNLLPKDAVRVVTRVQKIAVGVGTGGAVILTALMAMMFLSASSKVHDAQLTLDDLRAQLAIIPPPSAGPSAGATALAAQQGPRVAAVTAALQRRVAALGSATPRAGCHFPQRSSEYQIRGP